MYTYIYTTSCIWICCICVILYYSMLYKMISYDMRFDSILLYCVRWNDILSYQNVCIDSYMYRCNIYIVNSFKLLELWFATLICFLLNRWFCCSFLNNFELLHRRVLLFVCIVLSVLNIIQTQNTFVSTIIL